MAGVSLLVLKELLGHASIEMTMQYAHLLPRALKTGVTPIDTLGLDEGASHGTFTALPQASTETATSLSHDFFANLQQENLRASGGSHGATSGNRRLERPPGR
ncbi:MAG: hypothetical protein JWO36_5729 [Myxococcales bacterium]|nr:hypothetical protein [Myxococcales bacterium]